MASVGRGYSFSSTETVTNTKLHLLVDNATVSNIVDADISSGAQIQFSKLLATGIDASLFVGFPNAQVAAGKWPFANLPVPFGATYVSLVSIPNASLLPLNLTSWVDGSSFFNLSNVPFGAGNFPARNLGNLSSVPVNQGTFNYQSIVASLGSGGGVSYDGVNSFVGKFNKQLVHSSFNITQLSSRLNLTGLSIATGGTRMPFSGIFRNLYIQSDNNGVSNDISLYKNGVKTSLAIDGVIGGTYTDLVNSVNVATGDYLMWNASYNNNGSGAARITLSLELDT